MLLLTVVPASISPSTPSKPPQTPHFLQRVVLSSATTRANRGQAARRVGNSWNPNVKLLGAARVLPSGARERGPGWRWQHPHGCWLRGVRAVATQCMELPPRDVPPCSVDAARGDSRAFLHSLQWAAGSVNGPAETHCSTDHQACPCIQASPEDRPAPAAGRALRPAM